MQKKLALLPLALAVSLSLTACGSNKTEGVEPTTNQVESSIEVLEEADIEVSITAEELSDRYRSNEPMSDKEFKSKVAEIVGTIENLDEHEGKTFISLASHETEKSPLIHCFFSDDVDASEFNVGDEITIIGKIAGKKEFRDERTNVVIENSQLK